MGLGVGWLRASVGGRMRDGGGAGAVGGVEADGAAVVFDPAEGFGEAHAAVAAGGFGGEEGGEGVAHGFFGHADAAVGDLDDDLGVHGVEADLDEDVFGVGGGFGGGGGFGAAGLEGVEDYFGEGVFDLAGRQL